MQPLLVMAVRDISLKTDDPCPRDESVVKTGVVVMHGSSDIVLDDVEVSFNVDVLGDMPGTRKEGLEHSLSSWIPSVPIYIGTLPWEAELSLIETVGIEQCSLVLIFKFPDLLFILTSHKWGVNALVLLFEK